MPVTGQQMETSFSYGKYRNERIDKWATSKGVYLGTYGTYEGENILLQRIFGLVLGRYLCYTKTYFPKCLD